MPGSVSELAAMKQGIRLMMRTVVIVGTLLLGVSAVVAQQDVAVQQSNIMKNQGRLLYGTVGRMARGAIPFDKAALDTALGQLEESVAKIPAAFATNPKEDVKDGSYGASPKIWESKADFDSKTAPVLKAIADVKGKAEDAAGAKVAFDAVNSKCDACHDTYRVKLK
jgi:cytochrome c556